MTTFEDFEAFYQHVVQTALWCSTDESHNIATQQAVDRSLQQCGYTVTSLTERARSILRAHALSFWSRMWYYIDHEEPNGHDRIERAGKDFWLTSQGHGAGFWDGDWPKYGNMLTSLSKCYPEQLYLQVTPEGLDLV